MKRRGSRWEQIRIGVLQRDPLARVKVGALTPTDVAAWRDRRLQLVSNGSVRREMALLSAIFKIAAKEWGWLERNPITDIRWPPDNESRERRVTGDELAALKVVSGDTLETLTGRVVYAFEFAIETAMRGGEILAMRRANVHLADRWVHIPTSKNGDKRDVPLSRRAADILSDVLGLGQEPVWGMVSWQRDALFRKIVGRAGINDLHFHDSRHEAITRLSKKMDVLDLARTVGTRALKTLMTYYDRSAADLAKQL